MAPRGDGQWHVLHAEPGILDYMQLASGALIEAAIESSPGVISGTALFSIIAPIPPSLEGMFLEVEFGGASTPAICIQLDGFFAGPSWPQQRPSSCGGSLLPFQSQLLPGCRSLRKGLHAP